MKLLLKLATQNRRHYILFFFTILSMLGFTVASQLEMFSIGVVAKTGPDAFLLFAPKGEKGLEQTKELRLPEIEERWKELAPGGALTTQEAQRYILQHSKPSLLSKLNLYLDQTLKIGQDMKRLALVVLFVALFKALTLFFHRYLLQVIAIRVSRDLRLKYFRHIQSLPLSFYQDFDLGALTTRLTTDASIVAGSINALLLNFIQAPFTLLTTVAACCAMSLKLTILIFIGFPLVIIPVVLITKRIKHLSREIQKTQEQLGTTIIEFLSGILTIKIFSMEKLSFDKYQSQNHRHAKLDERSARYGNAARPIMHSISSLFFGVVIIIGLYVFQVPTADLFVFCALLYLFYEPIKKFSEQNIEIQRGVVAAERMQEVMKIQPAIQDHPGAKSLDHFDSLEFKNVSFKYNDRWVLNDLSFKVHKGEFVAIVGPTGAGKSTIVQLIPRLYEVQKGAILINGAPLSAYTQESLREQISFVSQKPFLFLDTIQANLSFGREFKPEEIRAAAKRAQAEEFILKLPNSYNHVLSETGKNLSGGQQQRLAIARALVKQAPLLILDEATSSLDSVSEAKIKEALEGLKGEMTQIVIAHRLSTIEKADKILFIDQGRLLAQGTKEELLENCPAFRLMWEMMFQSAQT